MQGFADDTSGFFDFPFSKQSFTFLCLLFRQIRFKLNQYWGYIELKVVDGLISLPSVLLLLWVSGKLVFLVSFTGVAVVVMAVVAGF